MASSRDSIPTRLLKSLSYLVYSRPKLFIWPQIILFGLSIFYTVQNLEFNMSRNDLVGSDKKYHQNYLRYKEEFRVQDDLVVVVESEHPEKNRQFVERLASRIEAETNLFKDVFFKGDLKMLGPKALLFLDEPTLKDLHARLQEFEPFVQQFAGTTNLASVFQMINSQFRAAARDTNAQVNTLISALPALRRIIELAADSLHRGGSPPSPGVTALFDAGSEAQEQQYITFDKGRLYLVTCKAVDESKNEPAVHRLRALAEQTYAEVPGVNMGLTGEPVLEVDEMIQSQKDSTIATILSLVLCALLFVVSYRETGRPLKATASLILGLGYTMGFTTLTVGHLNILTVTFLPILIGLAIDFAIHLITRFEEEIRHGCTQQVALEKAMVNTGLGIFTGCFTTAGAFFTMALTNFKGIQEMGIITGGGMLVCLIPMMSFLPALLLRGQQNIIDHIRGEPGWRRARLERLWLDRPRLVVALSVLVSILAVFPALKVRFDYNLLHMQSEGLPAVIFEHKLINSPSGKSVLFGVVIADSTERAIELEEAILKLPSVASTDSMARFLGGDQSQKLALISKIKQTAGRVQFASIDLEPVNVSELSRILWSFSGYLGLALQELHTRGEEPDLAKELEKLRNAVEELRHRMLTGNSKMVGETLGAYQRALFTDLRDTFRAIATQDDSAPLTPKDLPPSLRERFIGTTGRQVIQVYPKGDIWEREDQVKFVRDLRTIDPDVTGTPVQLLEYTTLLKNSYVEAAYYSLAAIIVLVLIHFHSLTAVILSLLPVALGSLWSLGIMGLFSIPFNPANIMTLPLVVGIGVTNGIHILNRFSEEQNPGILAKSTGKAVIVSALTTIAGFGSLIAAAHQGIQSLGIVMSLGVALCMIAGLTFLPTLLQLMIRWGWKAKRPSVDNAQSPLGREEPR